MPREGSRKLKVAAEIQRLLNELFLSSVKDPRLAGVRVSEVEVSGDLGLATVFFGTLNMDEDPRDAIEALQKARGFLRSRVGEALQLRRVPELRFRHDTSARHGFEVGRLLDDARPAAAEPDESSD
ncbi:MAG TPA: 30S ribosome-binding factor RbfA [Gammaproteobacteria bacterium]|nr:30S ribosome-binding factor RbfA [Gammaproteobacteria bacterium]